MAKFVSSDRNIYISGLLKTAEGMAKHLVGMLDSIVGGDATLPAINTVSLFILLAALCYVQNI